MVRLLTYITTFLIIVLCELGDKTQVATLIFASGNPHRKWQVFAAAACALVTCVTIEVTVGVALSRLVPPALINRITGVLFMLIGLFFGASLLREARRARRARHAPRNAMGASRDAMSNGGDGPASAIPRYRQFLPPMV